MVPRKWSSTLALEKGVGMLDELRWERSCLVAVDHPFLGDRRLEQALAFSLCGCVQRSGAMQLALGEAIEAFREDAERCRCHGE